MWFLSPGSRLSSWKPVLKAWGLARGPWQLTWLAITEESFKQFLTERNIAIFIWFRYVWFLSPGSRLSSRKPVLKAWGLARGPWQLTWLAITEESFKQFLTERNIAVFIWFRYVWFLSPGSKLSSWKPVLKAWGLAEGRDNRLGWPSQKNPSSSSSPRGTSPYSSDFATCDFFPQDQNYHHGNLF